MSRIARRAAPHFARPLCRALYCLMNGQSVPGPESCVTPGRKQSSALAAAEILPSNNFSPNSLLGLSLRKKKAGRDMLWPRPGACPPRVRPVSTMCPPSVCPVSALSSRWPCLQTLSAICLGLCLGLLWAGKILSRYCATHSVYIAGPLVSFLHIFIFKIWLTKFGLR